MITLEMAAQAFRQRRRTRPSRTNPPSSPYVEGSGTAPLIELLTASVLGTLSSTPLATPNWIVPVKGVSKV